MLLTTRGGGRGRAFMAGRPVVLIESVSTSLDVQLLDAEIVDAGYTRRGG